MSGLLGDPHAVHAIAVSYQGAATKVAALGMGFARQSDAAQWQCAKADRFRSAARQRQLECEETARRLMDIYADLVRLEARIRHDIARVEAIEAKVKSFFQGLPKFDLNGLPKTWPWDHLPWKLHALPTRHSPDWDRVFADLRRTGAL